MERKPRCKAQQSCQAYRIHHKRSRRGSTKSAKVHGKQSLATLYPLQHQPTKGSLSLSPFTFGLWQEQLSVWMKGGSNSKRLPVRGLSKVDDAGSIRTKDCGPAAGASLLASGPRSTAYTLTTNCTKNLKFMTCLQARGDEARANRLHGALLKRVAP